MFCFFFFLFSESFVFDNYLFRRLLLDLFHGFLVLNFFILGVNFFHVLDLSFAIVNNFVNVFGSIFVQFCLFEHSCYFPVFILFFFLDYMPYSFSIFNSLETGIIVALMIEHFIGFPFFVIIDLLLFSLLFFHLNLLRFLLANFFVLLPLFLN